jgi:hypothetical protein
MMTSSGSTLQPETGEGTIDYRKAAEKLAAADYQTRMEHFLRVKTSTPLKSFGGRPHGRPLNDRAR